VQRFTPILIDATRPPRHLAGNRWFVDETYVKVAGVWSLFTGRWTSTGSHRRVRVQRRDIASAFRFFGTALADHGEPSEVITDRAPALANVNEDLIP
jgi:transposase-like protein